MNRSINLLIPCAGKSERFFQEGFKKHKFLLETNNGLTIIESIIKTFNSKVFKPHLIFTSNQISLYESELDLLKIKIPNVKIHSIKEHSLGPTFSLMNIDLSEEDPILVHYCDFLTDFKHDELIELLKKNFIVAPYFKGFHPASLGNTNFAYMILDSIENLINLQEKKPFTKNRIEEPASTGIYGFPTYKLFKYLANNYLNQKKSWKLPEAYTSLILNEAIDKGYTVKCLKVKKFICLGTPRDYKEYIFWVNTYKKYLNPKKQTSQYSTHLITAAGEGARFGKFNYRIPKILNKFKNITLLEHSIQSLNNAKTHLLILQKDKFLIKDHIKINEKNLILESIDRKTEGQLLSLLKLSKSVSENKDFYVSSADYRFEINDRLFQNFKIKNDPEIVIFTTSWKDFAHSDTTNYGFMKVDQNKRIREIIEKPIQKPSSEILSNLIIGTFWFRNKSLIYELPIKTNQNNEVYIASAINDVLNKKKVFSFELDYWLSLGTPRELDLAKYWFDFFENEKFSK